jgi:hypothetical protein
MRIVQYEATGKGDLSKDEDTDYCDKQRQPTIGELATRASGHEGRTEYNPEQEAKEVEVSQYVIDLHKLFYSNTPLRINYRVSGQSRTGK